ncbi:MAG: hypothetical protein JWM21_1254 [Acidobacteria bacterium]|nr:hypothetical protein [Acidobacteriota bacterium]
MTQRSNTPVLIVGIVVALIVGSRLLSIALPERSGTVDPHVNLTENQAQQIVQRQRQQQVRAFMAASEGEVSRTEERIREATALATAASLFAAKESLDKRTSESVAALLSGVNAAGLLPPGMQLLDSSGRFSSARGQLFVRYRLEPLGIEVVSIGKERMDGPALLVRVPDNGYSGTSEEGAGLYLATRLDEITVPAPFAPEAEVIALGFAPEPLRAVKLPNPEGRK